MDCLPRTCAMRRDSALIVKFEAEIAQQVEFAGATSWVGLPVCHIPQEGSIGGFGSHVANFLADSGMLERGLKFRSVFLPDTFLDQNSPEKMYESANMHALQIEAKVLAVLGVSSIGVKRA